LQHLQWLVSTGHVVAFAKMGVYSAVEKFPKYGPQWKKRSAKKAEAPKSETGEAGVSEVTGEPPAPQVPQDAPVPPDEQSAAPVAEEAPAAPEAPAAQDTTVSEKKEEPQNEAPTQLAE
jgi:hypothetical protein